MAKKNPDEQEVTKATEAEASSEECAEACEVAEPEEITVPKSKMDELEAEVADAKDRHLRLAAEYDNFRKRTSREREMLFADATATAVGEFLPIYDNFERALQTPTEDAAYRKGVEMIFTQLCETMKKLKVEEINPAGEKFDPNLHNAVMHVEDEALDENMVTEVFQKGFKIGDKVIHHAMVKVAN